MFLFHKEIPNYAAFVHAFEIRQIASFCSGATAFKNLHYKVLMRTAYCPCIFAFTFVKKPDNSQQVHPETDANNEKSTPKGKVIPEQQ